MREIEVKMKVGDSKAVEQRLREKGCVLEAPIHQYDIVYSKAGSTAEWEKPSEGHMALRIRRQDDGAIFTLKQQRSGEGDNIEIETKVSEPDEMHRALGMLGYTPEVEVKKNRRRGKMGEYTVCLDEVEELGTFLELEKLTSDDADPEKVREELMAILESIGLRREDEETRGYDTQIFQLHAGRESAK